MRCLDFCAILNLFTSFVLILIYLILTGMLIMICLFCPNIEACIAKFIIDNGITQLVSEPTGINNFLDYNYSLTSLLLCLTFRSYSRLAPATTVQLPGKHGSRAILAFRARVTSILVMLTMLVLIVI